MLKFDLDRFRQLEVRSDQLNAGARLASHTCSEARAELRRRELRWQKASDSVARTLHVYDEDHEKIAAFARDVEAARARFEVRDHARMKAHERWTAAGRLFRSCQDFLLNNGVSDPDAPHDEHRASSGLGVGR